MLALNITRPYAGTPADMSASAIQARARGGWQISKTWLAEDADVAVAVDHNRVVGVFTIRGWKSDPDVDGQVVLDLVPDPEWKWLVGLDSPVHWTRSQTRPVRRLSRIGLNALADLRPAAIRAKGWNLTVDPDGATATVLAPGPIVVTALNNGLLQLRVDDQKS